MIIYNVLVLLLSFYLSIPVFSFLINFLSFKLPDQPNHRSLHKSPVPRGGGIVFVFISVLSSSICLLQGNTHASPFLIVPFLLLPLSLVGLIDDRFNLPPLIRFFVQFISAILILFFSPLVSFSLLRLPLVLLIAFFVTAIINFSNFMDGLDGLLAGCLSISLLFVSYEISAPWPFYALVGSILAFLFFNWSPAKIFMGDVGSTFLGAIFSALVLQSDSWFSAFNFLLVLTPILADSTFCLFRRFFNHQPIFEPHRLHLFQRLYQAGLSHSQISSLYITCTLFLCLALVFGNFILLLFSSLFVVIIGFLLDRYVAVSFASSS